jgi:hypothetical protein
MTINIDLYKILARGENYGSFGERLHKSYIDAGYSKEDIEVLMNKYYDEAYGESD